MSDVTDSVALRRDLQTRTSTDLLTGCLSRGATLEYVAAMIQRSLEDRTGIMVAYVDIDEFKTINDHYGHGAGDDVLVALAGQLCRVLRDGDRVGRVGGDELLVVCPSVPDETSAVDIAQRLRRAACGVVEDDPHQISWKASIGTAWAAGATSSDELITRADADMYAEKHSREPGSCGAAALHARRRNAQLTRNA